MKKESSIGMRARSNAFAPEAPWKAGATVTLHTEGAGKTQLEAIEGATLSMIAELREALVLFSSTGGGGSEAERRAAYVPVKESFDAGVRHCLNVIVEAAEQWQGGTLEVGFVDFLKQHRRDGGLGGAP